MLQVANNFLKIIKVLLIEEVWKQKPRQIVVIVFWGKIAAHMAFIKTV